MLSGFLVVFEPRLSRNTGKLYAGVGRVPPYPSDKHAEQPAMDEYVFGGVKEPDTNVIPSLKTAVQLRDLLSRSGRRFDIIYCRDEQQPIPYSEPEIESAESLGFDIVTIRTEYWSIVDDMSLNDWAIPYRRTLNRNGLFPEKQDAENYLRGYRAHKEWDAEFDFDVIEVIRVKLK